MVSNLPGGGEVRSSDRPSEAAGTARVSRFGFGCAPIGNLYDEVSEQEADAALREAFEAGIRYFDTAPYYGYGLSESRLGRALAGRRRESFVVSTKVGRRIESNGGGRCGDGFAVAGKRAVFDYSRDGVQRSIEASLTRLAISKVDILLLHDVGELTHGARHPVILKQALNEALPAMAALKAAGVVGAIGIGVNEEAVCLEVMHRFDLDCLMLAGRYTLLEQHASVQVMREAQRRGVKVIVAAPYNSGLLADADGPGTTYNYRPVEPSVLDRARRIYALCASEGLDVGAAALQFPLAHPAVTSVVAGLRSAREVGIATARLRAIVPTRLWARIKEAGLLDASAEVPSP